MNKKFKYYIGQRWLMWEEDIEEWTEHIIAISQYYENNEIQIVMIDVRSGCPIAEPTSVISVNDNRKTYIPKVKFEDIAATDCGFEWKPASKQEQLEYHRAAGIGDYFKEQGNEAIYLLSSAGVSDKGNDRLVLIDIMTGKRLGPVVEVKDVKNITKRKLLELNYEMDTLYKIQPNRTGLL